MTEVNKYNHSNIYKICSNLTDKIYIGSTTQTLAQRLSEHTSDYKQYIKTNTKHITSFEIIELGDSYITLIEEHNFNNRQQLFKREGEVMKLNSNNVVNMMIAGRTYKEYYNDNKEHLAEHKKEYYTNNKEHILEYHNKYRLDNRQVISVKKKQNYIDNRDQITEMKKQTTICECGTIINKQHKLRHMKTTKHINLIQQLFNNELTYYN
jgi:hypothetical protein